MRAALATSFHAVGRAGEIGLLSWKALYWNHTDENLRGTWAQKKVSNSLDVNFFADVSSYAIDEFHCLACYAIMGGGARLLTPQNSNKAWNFPSLAGTTTATAMSNYLKDLVRQCN